MQRSQAFWSVAALVGTCVLVACGGGGGAASGDSGTGVSTPTSVTLTSSGTIDAFGSVFVNGQEFATGSANIINDDAGTSNLPASTLEVGMAVDVMAAANSTPASPVAGQIHLRALAIGYVDASDTNAGTVTVMGQSAEITAATAFSDHRACLTATPACSPVSGQSDLTATSVSGNQVTPGSYVAIYGFDFSTGAQGSQPGTVATLVQVGDAPSSPGLLAFKAEGAVSAVSGSTLTIGGLSVDLSAATCYADGASTPCGSAYAVGQIVSAFGPSAPALPATSFQPSKARLIHVLQVQTAGAPVQFAGAVSAVSTSPAGFTLRGVAVDASALGSGSLPALGDIVRVTGTVASDGTSIVASAVSVLHAARSATFGFEGDAGGVTAGPAPETYVLTVLGQSIAVDASTRLADHSVRPSGPVAGTNPFNISTFQTYLAASASQHLEVVTQADNSGNLSAMSVTILPASTHAAVEGVVDATPAPVNASPGSQSTLSVHGVPVSADPAAVLGGDGSTATGLGHQKAATVAAGDLVDARGIDTGGVITVTTPVSPSNVVIDLGAPKTPNHSMF